MDSMDNLRERFEALEQQMKVIGAQTRTVERRLRWWLGIACGVLLLSLVSLAPPSQATDFSCTAGDVACLIDAINQGNANGEANTITLEAATYTLTAVDNNTDGPNGLPSITSPLTIKGDGAATTILERASGAPAFRLVYVATSGNLTLTGVTLRGGDNFPAGIGSGLFNNGGVVIITQSTVTQNQNGGLSTNGGTVRITQSSFTGNFGEGVAGGLQVAGGLVIITQSTVDHNGSGVTGGISIDHPAVVTIVNSTVADNSVDGIGGGILNGGVLLITNSTIARNHARFRGAGISNATVSTVLLWNTILALNTTTPIDNTDRLAPSSDCIGPVTSLGNNLIGDPTGCTITLQPSDLTGDPGLDAFTDNGRPGNGHFPLLPTSPAIDAGSDAVCPRTDQLGQRRIGPCDIGAIRFLDQDDRQHKEEDDQQQEEDPATTAQKSQ